jgi:serine/threonine protein phosphatase 1
MRRRKDLLGIREEFSKKISARSWCMATRRSRSPNIRPNRINIDTGAYATGRLTCLVLEGDQMSFI